MQDVQAMDRLTELSAELCGAYKQNNTLVSPLYEMHPLEQHLSAIVCTLMEIFQDEDRVVTSMIHALQVSTQIGLALSDEKQ